MANLVNEIPQMIAAKLGFFVPSMLFFPTPGVVQIRLVPPGGEELDLLPLDETCDIVEQGATQDAAVEEACEAYRELKEGTRINRNAVNAYGIKVLN